VSYSYCGRIVQAVGVYCQGESGRVIGLLGIIVRWDSNSGIGAHGGFKVSELGSVIVVSGGDDDGGGMVLRVVLVGFPCRVERWGDQKLCMCQRGEFNMGTC